MRRPSPSFFISVAALVVATSGTSYAAMTIGSQDIRDNSVQGRDIRTNTIVSGDVKNGSLRAKDFAGRLPAGPKGATGATGARGPAGADGVGRWALVDATGTIVAQSGGFEVVAAYPTLPNTAPVGDNSLRAAGNVYLDANEDLSDNGILTSIALQNTVDQDADMITNGRAPGADANPEFSGEISTSLCSYPGATGIPTNCAPAGAQNATSFVVSPRNSDGSVTEDDARKRFYVVITGDSSDFVAPTGS